MAELGFQFCFISTLLVCFLSSSCSVYSRNLILKTSVLDISASVQRTLDVLSFDSKTLEQLQEQSIESFDSSSEFTLQLHSRDVLHKSSAQDYESLMLARLERDGARVKSLNLKVNLAIKGIKKSDLKPLEEDGIDEAKAANKLDSPIISGLPQGSGEYFTRIGIGSPPQSFYMVLDTGSDVTWLQCEPCTDCYQQSDPVFKPSSSSSYSSLSCNSDECRSLDVSACRNETCLYQVSYGDGSFTVGNYATETLSFGNSGSVSKISLGCGHDNEGLFVGAAGIIALGGGTLSFPTQTKSNSFSYCLVDRDSSSSSTLEFFSSSSSPPELITAPLHKNPKIDTFYYPELAGISIGGHALPIDPSSFQMDSSGIGGVIIDSGTAVTRLRAEIYNVLRDAFKSGTAHLPSTSGFALFDTCYDLSSMGASIEVPTVDFLFPDGKSLPLPAKNYLIPVDSKKTFCFAFAGTRSSLSIIGNLQQQGVRVSFNAGKSVIGFSGNKC